jgi:hypothetical protein
MCEDGKEKRKKNRKKFKQPFDRLSLDIIEERLKKEHTHKEEEEEDGQKPGTFGDASFIKRTRCFLSRSRRIQSLRLQVRSPICRLPMVLPTPQTLLPVGLLHAPSHLCPTATLARRSLDRHPMVTR